MSFIPVPGSISGSVDGQVPVYDPLGLWKIWAYHEIFFGDIGEGRYVPKIKDYVVDIETNEWYIVLEVDQTTYVPRLKKIKNIIDPGPISDEDLLLGVGPGTQADTYRIYIDKSVTPHAFTVDQRLKVAGTMTKYCIIYRGSSSGQRVAISMFYDPSGNFLGNQIPLELVVMPNAQNVSVKTVRPAYTKEDLPNGEVVIAVFYGDDGHVVSQRQLLVENTAFIRSVQDDVEYVSHISLESPFLSSADPNLILYPLNVPVHGLNLMGVVHYNTGKKVRMPVDGNRFSVFGLDGYISTIIGAEKDLVLKYALAPGEAAYGTSVGEGHHLSASYKLRTVKADNAYTLRLHGYPEWVPAEAGYRMRYWLFNLDRKTFYDATGVVRVDGNSPPFRPNDYGILQRITVNVNLQQVNGSYRDYKHVQVIDVNLKAPGNEPPTNWTVSDPGAAVPYGEGLVAKTEFVNQNLKRVNIGSGATTKEDWIKRVYRQASPIQDVDRLGPAPEPDFFIIHLGAVELEFPISRWNDTLVISAPMVDTATMFIRFIRRTPDSDMQLVMSAMPIHFQ